MLGRSPRGVLVRGSLRAVSRENAGTRLTRFRVALGGGYAYRRGRFELLADAAATIEPLFVSRATRPEGGGRQGPRPLFGALVGLAPGAIVTAVDQSFRMRVFGRVELAGSAEAQSSPGVVRILDDDGAELGPVLRAGGLELTLCAGVGFWFGTPAR